MSAKNERQIPQTVNSNVQFTLLGQIVVTKRYARSTKSHMGSLEICPTEERTTVLRNTSALESVRNPIRR